jgi:hypothetical protein
VGLRGKSLCAQNVSVLLRSDRLLSQCWQLGVAMCAVLYMFVISRIDWDEEVRRALENSALDQEEISPKADPGDDERAGTTSALAPPSVVRHSNPPQVE